MCEKPQQYLTNTFVNLFNINKLLQLFTCILLFAVVTAITYSIFPAIQTMPVKNTPVSDHAPTSTKAFWSNGLILLLLDFDCVLVSRKLIVEFNISFSFYVMTFDSTNMALTTAPLHRRIQLK